MLTTSVRKVLCIILVFVSISACSVVAEPLVQPLSTSNNTTVSTSRQIHIPRFEINPLSAHPGDLVVITLEFELVGDGFAIVNIQGLGVAYSDLHPSPSETKLQLAFGAPSEIGSHEFFVEIYFKDDNQPPARITTTLTVVDQLVVR